LFTWNNLYVFSEKVSLPQSSREQRSAPIQQHSNHPNSWTNFTAALPASVTPQSTEPASQPSANSSRLTLSDHRQSQIHPSTSKETKGKARSSYLSGARIRTCNESSEHWAAYSELLDHSASFSNPAASFSNIQTPLNMLEQSRTRVRRSSRRVLQS